VDSSKEQPTMTTMPDSLSTETLSVLLTATRLGADGFAGYPGALLAAVSPLSRFLPAAERREYAGEVSRRLTCADAASALMGRELGVQEGAELAMDDM
jgi:hypothetical protein